MSRHLLQEYEAIIAKNPFAAQLGIEFLEVSEGYVRSRVKKQKHLENLYGDLHGGCLYSIADNMAGIAAGTYGNYVTTLNGSIQYLKAARNTEYVYCKANVIKAGKTIAVVHVEISDDAGMLLNTAEFLYFNLKKKETV